MPSRSLWYHFNECYWYGALTHWPLGNVAIILNVWFWNIFQWLVSMYFQCHIVMISQYWFRSWLGAVMQQAVTWANVKTIWHPMSSLCLNDLMGLTYQKTWSPLVLVLACWLICCEPLANTLTNAFISSLRSLGMQPNGQMVWLLSHPGIPGVTLCFVPVRAPPPATDSYVTIRFDLGHDLDLEFSRSNMEFPIFQTKVVRLPRNEKQTYRLSSRPQMWPMGLTLTIILTFEFWRSNMTLTFDHTWPWPWIFMVKFRNSSTSEWEGWLTLHKVDGRRSFMTMTIWWPRSGVWIYQIVTGVTSVVCVPSTHLV